MTSAQIEELSKLLASQLPSLILEKPASESDKPFKPKNFDQLVMNWKDVRTLLTGQLQNMGILK
jgi:hypothetical protein